MKLQKLEYLVGDLPEYPQQLTITPDEIRYESHSNLSNPASLGIGLYERAPSKQELAAIESEFDLSSFRSAADHHGQVLSGDRWRRIRLTSGGETIEKLVGTKRPVDPTLQKAIERLDGLVTETVQHPRSVLQMKLEEAALDRDGQFSATMILSGTGDRKVMFRPPQARSDSLDGAVVVYWWPHDPHGEKANVQSARVVSIAQIPGAAKDGALATLRIRQRLEGLSSRPLVVQVQYSNMTQKMDTFEVLTGHLFSVPAVVR